jgi:hypothetical protein
MWGKRSNGDSNGDTIRGEFAGGLARKGVDVLLTFFEDLAEARSRTTFHNAVVALVSLYLVIAHKFPMGEKGCANDLCRKEKEKRGRGGCD